jgi:SAM-dependent methyltransferase
MAQNIYDRADFFTEYSLVTRSVKGISDLGTRAPEWPVMKALIPSVKEARFLDLGCGYGWYCRWAREEGAEMVTGIDISEKMLARAKESTHDAAITYLRADMETLTLTERAYDVVFSSLALHYLPDFGSLAKQVYETLEPGGAFVFSVEHPTFTAPGNPHWIKDSEGRAVWPLVSYLSEGKRITDWLADGVVKYHRMASTYVNTLLTTGFVLSVMEEWAPSVEQIDNGLGDWAKARDRPPFLILKAEKPRENTS